ncbi:hypothetical protein PGT21_005312 [Puccinia graminis f. sp. tritici]|uniref:Lysophospholipase n=1 Tax=Puccinia graminis f. sp. tritici TaxID=56615 RepID=A0A5B0NKL4_PUCGR|nr:hypothetical protein PGT21_005312 [Puccinia graminis f. sp. tritici]
MRLINIHLTCNTLLWGQIILVNFCPESQAADSSRPTTPIPAPNSYAPERVSCPAHLSVSTSSAYPWPASSAEQAYVSSKTAKSLKPWEDYLSRVNLKGFDVKEFLKSSTHNGLVAGRNLPNIAFSLTGGGNRALLYSAAILDAFDSRNPDANKARTGGVLQLANFASGLSSSSWFLASWGNANFVRFPELADHVWQSEFSHDYFSWNQLKHYIRHYRDARQKKKAGFHVSAVENDPNIGRTLTLSSMRYKSEYVQQSFPFPIIVATSRKQEGADIDGDSPIYEFTPEDVNVWHPTLNATFPIEYLGSKTGAATNKATECVTGFDNIGLVRPPSQNTIPRLSSQIESRNNAAFNATSVKLDQGASSNIFSYLDGKVKKKSFLSRVMKMFVKGRFYEALVPNPFMGQGKGPTPGHGFPDGENEELLLADGALAQESMPLFPFLQPSRMVDVIMAVDSAVNGKSFDNPNEKGYPNGTSLYRTSMKLKQNGYGGYKFPDVPETYQHTTFTDRGYNRRPTFFGCDKDVPLVVYLPNHFVTKETDQSTMQAVYKKEEIKGSFENGFYIATQTHPSQNGTEWPACLACALIDRQNTRNGTPRTPQCTSCFSSYCASGF